MLYFVSSEFTITIAVASERILSIEIKNENLLLEV